MKLRMLLLLLGSILTCSTGRAFQQSDLESLQSHDFQFSKAIPLTRGALAIHTAFFLRGKEIADRSDLMYAVFREKLARAGIEASAGDDAFFRQFRSHADASSLGTRRVDGIALRRLLQPRLVVRFEATPQRSGKQYHLQGYLWLVGHEAEKSPSSETSLKIVWSRSIHVRDLNEGEIFEKLVYASREALDDFTPFYRKWREGFPKNATPPRPPFAVTSLYRSRELPEWLEKEESPSRPAPPTTLSENAPATIVRPSTRRALQLGASVGTPATANLNVGIWGMGSAPLTTHLAGMYYSPETRGVQMDLGWIFDREGSFQQSAGLTFALFNESHDETSVILDSQRRGTTQVVHVHEAKPFIGATYTGQWGPVRLQAGPSFRVGPGNDQSFRILIQAGFVPQIAF